MMHNIQACKDVLINFLDDFEKIRKFHQDISAPVLAPFYIDDQTPDMTNVHFQPESESYLRQEETYAWIYGEPLHYRALMHFPNAPQIGKYFQREAQSVYQEWYHCERDVIFRGEPIPEPTKGTTLHEYLYELSEIVKDGNEKRIIWHKSLNSFCQFIKEHTHDRHGNLETIFPNEKIVEDSYQIKKTEQGFIKIPCQLILRNPQAAEYPITIFTASTIIQNLINAVQCGRRQGQHNTAQALGLAWLCLAVGSARIMAYEEFIRIAPISALKIAPLIESEKLFKPECHITIDSLHGPREVPISKTLYNFLLALPRDPTSKTIFTQPLSTLLRSFYNQGLQNSETGKFEGKITFRTLMAPLLPFDCPRPKKRPPKIHAKV